MAKREKKVSRLPKTKLGGKVVSSKLKRSDGQLSAKSRDGKGIVGKKAVQANVRISDKIDSLSASISAMGHVSSNVTSMVAESREDILCVVNPQILFQYIYGVVMSPISSTDSPQTINTACSIINFLVQAFADLPDQLSNISLPKAIVRLRKALDSRTIGHFTFTPDWSECRSFAVALATSGFSDANLGTRIAIPTGPYDASGFIATTLTPVGITGSLEQELSRFFGTYSSYYEMVSIIDYVDDKKDASAFAFSLSPPLPNSLLVGSAVVTMVGYGSGGENLYFPQNGDWALETRVFRPDLASLRLCTPVPQIIPGTAANAGVTNRRPVHSDMVIAAPSVLGWASGRFGVRGRILMKQVPVVRLLSAVIRRLEALVSSLPTASLNTFLSSWSANEIKVLAYAWYRNYIRRFAGAQNGAYAVTQSFSSNAFNVSMTSANFPEMGAGFLPAAHCEIPEYISRLFGALSTTMDSKSTLIPLGSVINLNDVTTSLTYTGTTYATIPPVTTPGSLQNNNVMSTAVKYKSYEALLAQFENLVSFGLEAPSFLDCSFLISSGGVVAMSSRRPLKDALYKQALQCTPAISYDQGEAINQAYTAFDISRAVSTKEFGSYFRRELSGINTLDDYTNLYRQQGIVLNGFTNNIIESGGEGVNLPVIPPGRAPGEGDLEYYETQNAAFKERPVDWEGPVNGVAAKLVSKVFSGTVGKGKYCGPGWTAGKFTHSERVQVKAGKYIVEPLDKEDAICKVHDEAYRSSKGEASAVDRADKEMIASLDKLRQKEGLSLYGYAMKAAIMAKVLAWN